MGGLTSTSGVALATASYTSADGQSTVSVDPTPGTTTSTITVAPATAGTTVVINEAVKTSSTNPTILNATTAPVTLTVAPPTVSGTATGQSVALTVDTSGASNTGVTFATVQRTDGTNVVTIGTAAATTVVKSLTVSSGAISLAGNLTTSTLAVSGAGTTLSGTGTITNAAVTIGAGSTFKPGNSPGVSTIANGSLTLISTVAGSSNLKIDIDGTTPGNGPSNYSQVVGTGTTTISLSGTLTPELGSDITWSVGETATGYKNPGVGQKFTIIKTDAANGVSGSFSGLTVGAGTQAALRSGTGFTTVYNSNSVDLYVTPTKYQNLSSSGVVLSSNETGSATALQALRDASIANANGNYYGKITGNDDLKSLFDNLASRTAPQLQSAFNQLDGAEAASLGVASVRTANTFSDALTARADHNRIIAQSGLLGTNVAGLAGGDVNSGGKGDRRWAAWVQPIGHLGTVDGDSNGPGFDQTTIGVLTGLEGNFGNSTLGISYGYGWDKLEFKNFGNESKSDNHVVSIYGGSSFGRAFVNANLGYTWQNVETERYQSIGTYVKKASGKTDGGIFSVGGTVGYTFTPNSFVVEPTVGLRYANVHLDGYSETGAGVTNLRVGKLDYDSLQSTLAVRVSKSFKLDNGTTLVPQVKVGWQRELLDETSKVTSTLTSNSTAFSVSSTKPGVDAAVVDLGVKAEITNQFDLYADYTGRYSGSSTDHGLTAGLKYKF